MDSRESQAYWDYVALEAQDKEILRVKKWKRAARNWLADYADKRASDFIRNVVENVIKLDNSSKVLDVGCGPGKWARFFAHRCSTVTAVDVSPEMVELARRNTDDDHLTNVNFRVMNVSKMELPDKTFDLVNCVTVLQHIQNDDQWRSAIEGLVKATKLGGKILLFETAPNLVAKKRTSHLRITSMKHYIDEFRKSNAHLVYWQAVDLSLPITLFGLKNYASSFNRKVYYFFAGRLPQFSVNFLSFLSRTATILAEPVDYRLGRTPLGFLSLGRIMVFEKGN